MSLPSPKERPDLYDNDIPMDRELSKAYVERTMPEHLKKRIADRAEKPAPRQQAAE